MPPEPRGQQNGERAAEKEALEARRAVLGRLGRLCLRQKLHHFACRSFTAAADVVTAMECLLKTGDTEKIIYFASKP